MNSTLCIKAPLRLGGTENRLMTQAIVESSHVWNDCLAEAKDHHIATGKLIGKYELQKKIKHRAFAVLPSQSVQSVCSSYAEARTAAFEARKKGFRNKLPYRQKDNFPATWKGVAFAVTADGTIGFGRSVVNKKIQPWFFGAVDPIGFAGIDIATISEITVTRSKGQFFVNMPYKRPVPDLAFESPDLQVMKGHTTVAADPGEINIVAMVASNGQSCQISGRGLRSAKRFRNKEMGKLATMQKRCTKGSRRFNRLQKAKTELSAKTDRITRYHMHCTTKKVAAFCADVDAKVLVVGNIEGIQRHRKKGKRRRSKKHNQKMSQWGFGLFNSLAAYKLLLIGCLLAKQTEEFTTQACPACTRLNKPAGRVYRCRCGYTKPRDIHGACNQLSKWVHGTFVPVELAAPITYLRSIDKEAFRRKAEIVRDRSRSVEPRQTGTEKSVPGMLPVRTRKSQRWIKTPRVSLNREPRLAQAA